MGVFSKPKERLDPWFCVPCDLSDMSTGIPLKLKDDPYPGVRFGDLLKIENGEAKMYVRAVDTESATVAARRHIEDYGGTRDNDVRDARAA